MWHLQNLILIANNEARCMFVVRHCVIERVEGAVTHSLFISKQSNGVEGGGGKGDILLHENGILMFRLFRKHEANIYILIN